MFRGFAFRTIVVAAGVAATVAVAFAELDGGFDGSPEHPSIGYPTRSTKDPVGQLNREIQSGMTQLKFEAGTGYLRSVLRALHIPVESQILVFSKTSVQAHLIRPDNPRALYFNDSVVIGYVHGGFLEAASVDPQQGVIFYTLDQRPSNYLEPQTGLPHKLRFMRDDRCLQCHVSYASYSIPGLLERSVYPGTDGMPVRQLGDHLPDHRTPLDQRWGGWYVTGKSGSMRHMGNSTVANPDAEDPLPAAFNLTALTGKFDPGGYLSPLSDIASLMVFDHQTHMINLLIRTGWEVRYGQYLEKHPGENRDPSSPNLAARIRSAAEEVADYMLFVDEAPLANPVEGTSKFAEKFSDLGPGDAQGRSLRELDLKTRLLRYPCSYMIYSEVFDSLPPEAKSAIYARLWQILSGREKSPKYARLSLQDRQAILQILRETKKGLPNSFNGSVE